MIVKMPERNITISYKRAGIYKEVYMRHLMSPLDFSVEELDKLLDLANDICVTGNNPDRIRNTFTFGCGRTTRIGKT